MPCAALLAVALAVTPGAAEAQDVRWYRFASTCEINNSELAESPETTTLACGEHGRFVFGQRGLTYGGGCPYGTGAGTPAVYPVEISPDEPDLSSDLDSGAGADPWVAVVDWNTPHGWNVAEIIRAASDERVQVELFDLANSAGSLPSWLTSAGDAHVLAQLCAVADRAATHPENPPLAVNLSLGRLADGTGCSSQAASLGCEIEGVLAHLRTRFGTVPVAAAGNNGLLLFPASSSQVLAAGAMDLAWYQRTGQVLPSSETPAGAEALVPGYGIYLALQPPPQGKEYWAMPAGSSYASAVTTGWIAGARTAAPGAGPGTSSGPDRWVPVPCGRRFCLARNGQILPGSGLETPTTLLERALGDRPVVCAAHPPEAAPVVVAGPAVGLPETTLPKLAQELNSSQPGYHPCIPCHGGGGDPLEIPRRPLVVDMERSEPLPFAVEGLFLQVGDTVYELDRSYDAPLLESFENGTLPALGILGLESAMHPGDQLSLVYVLRTQAGRVFRDATPIHVHEH